MSTRLFIILFMQYHHIHFDIIDSTNTYLKNSYRLLNNFTFASASYQSHGKGRNERIWQSKKGDNLLFSLLLKEKKYMDYASKMSLFMAVEIAQILQLYGIKNVSIKWPNDVYVNNKKICGILTESQIPDYLVIGVGLNVNQKEFPDGLRSLPTSMCLESKKTYDIDELKIELFGQIINSFNNVKVEKYLEYFIEHNYLLEKRVKVTINNQDFIGEVVGIDHNFCLKIVTRDMLLHVDSGEITIL